MLLRNAVYINISFRGTANNALKNSRGKVSAKAPRTVSVCGKVCALGKNKKMTCNITYCRRGGNIGDCARSAWTLCGPRSVCMTRIAIPMRPCRIAIYARRKPCHLVLNQPHPHCIFGVGIGAGKVMTVHCVVRCAKKTTNFFSANSASRSFIFLHEAP